MKNIENKSTVQHKLRLYILGLIFCSVIFSSCENFVDVGVPDSQLTGETVFGDANTAKAALLQIYRRLNNDVLISGSQNGLSLLLGYYADELTYYPGQALPEEKFFQNNLLPSNETIATVWNDSYNLIYSANSILEGVTNSSGISEQDKNQLNGEALFIRAYIHFYLLNLYGSVPYVTTTDYRTNTTIGKMDEQTMYPLLIADLEQAKTLLPDAYAGADRVRPNRSVVSAMLARVYLYNHNWEAAETEANLVIGNTALYSLVNNLDNVFLKNSPGILWQTMSQTAGTNTQEAQLYIFTSGPPPARALSNELISSFESGDQRKEHWVGSVSDGSDTWYYAYKYKQNSNTGTSVEYSILFRLEELYLIRSEARARLGNITGSREDLNKIRNRAGLADTPADTEEELLNAILQERRVELFLEHGHRWFDLKRTNRTDAVLATKPGWDSYDILWPLPERQLLLNPNLRPQNQGY